MLLPVSEVLLTTDSIARFRAGYRELFGNATDDALYEAVSAGQRHVGMEHWLPLFHERLETLLDYCPEAVVTADHQIDEAFEARLRADHRLLRRARSRPARKGGMTRCAPTTSPLPPERLYLKPSEWDRLLEGHSRRPVHQLRCRARRAEHRSTSPAAATRALPGRARRRASTCSTWWPST